jgi:hypothetical protein
MSTVQVASRSRPGEAYLVLVGVDGAATCTCPGYEYRETCWHVAHAIGEMMPDDSLALVPLKVTPPKSLVPSTAELDSISKLAESLMPARGFAFPRELDHPGKLYAVMVFGLALGVSPTAALRSIYIVNGRPQPSAELMAGIVMAAESDATFEIRELTDATCTMRIQRPARNIDAEYTYTIEDARRANLIKAGNPWSTFPRDMLRHAAMKRLCRAYAPDLINGLEASALSSPDEAEPAPAARRIEAKVVRPAAPIEVDVVTGEIVDGDFTEATEAESPVEVEMLAGVPIEHVDEATELVVAVAAENGITPEAVLSAWGVDIFAVAADLDAYRARVEQRRAARAQAAQS